MIQGTCTNSCVLLDKNAQEVGSQPIPLPYGMNAGNRRCFQCGGQPQNLGVLGTVPEEVERTNTGNTFVLEDCSCLGSFFLPLPLLLSNDTHVDTYSGETVHCHVNGIMVLLLWK